MIRSPIKRQARNGPKVFECESLSNFNPSVKNEGRKIRPFRSFLSGPGPTVEIPLGR